MKKSFIDRRFGMLVVEKELMPIIYPNGRLCRMFESKCDCGNQSINRLTTLLGKSAKSCGCLRVESEKRTSNKHRKWANSSTTDRGLYHIWHGMIKRCSNEKCNGYKGYGSRGIKVCEAFRDFDQFFELFGRLRPSKSHSMDRRDNDGHYSCGECEECIENGWPRNVRWATDKEQSRNRRTTRMLTCNGETKPLPEWSEITGLKVNTIRSRLFTQGLSVQEALSKPVENKERPY